MFSRTSTSTSTAIRTSARRTTLVAIALLVGLFAALMAGPAAANAAPAHHHSYKGHHTTKRHANRKLTSEEIVANSLLVMLNGERRAHGLAPLTMSRDLMRSAHTHNEWMARTNFMSHQESGEPDLASRISKTGYKWSWAGENIGWNSEMNQAGVLQLESMMYHEKAPDNGHRLNILSTHFKNIGVDVYMDKTNKKVWLTTDFGRH